MYTLRTRIETDIICEFLPPRNGKGERAIIVCDGLPSVPSKRRVLEYWSHKGFWVFHPRYRGTWESGGRFLDHDPTEDILDVVRAVKTETLVSAYDGAVYTPKVQHVTVLGASFGGTVALLSSLHSEVDHAIALSPVVDWVQELGNTVEPLEWMKSFLGQGFGEAYRFRDSDFDRLGHDAGFFNPSAHVDNFDPKKLFIIYAKDDMIVSVPALEAFVEQLACHSTARRRGGHFSASLSTSFFISRSIRRFIG